MALFARRGEICRHSIPISPCSRATDSENPRLSNATGCWLRVLRPKLPSAAETRHSRSIVGDAAAESPRDYEDDLQHSV
jgi:hypothetical protein